MVAAAAWCGPRVFESDPSRSKALRSTSAARPTRIEPQVPLMELRWLACLLEANYPAGLAAGHNVLQQSIPGVQNVSLALNQVGADVVSNQRSGLGPTRLVANDRRNKVQRDALFDQHRCYRPP